MIKRFGLSPVLFSLACLLGTPGCADESDSETSQSEGSDEELSLSGIQSSSESGDTGDSPCTLPIDPGPCEAAIQSYGFLPDLGECIAFDYGGCDGNGNRFETLEECVFTCEDGPTDGPSGRGETKKPIL